MLDLRGGAEGGTEGVQQQHGGGGGVVGCSALEAVTVQRLPLGAGPGGWMGGRWGGGLEGVEPGAELLCERKRSEGGGGGIAIGANSRTVRSRCLAVHLLTAP